MWEIIMKIKSFTLVQTYHRTLSAHENGMAANIFLDSIDLLHHFVNIKWGNFIKKQKTKNVSFKQKKLYIWLRKFISSKQLFSKSIIKEFSKNSSSLFSLRTF